MIIPVNDELVLGISGAGDDGEMPPPGTVFLNQIHGSDILVDPVSGESADGMILARGSGYPGLKVADCLPVFAVWRNHTGAAHAGWRGLAGGIVENLLLSVDDLLEVLIMGPAICPLCYEVGEEVRKAVADGDPGGLEAHPEGRVDLAGSAARRARTVSGCGFPIITVKGCTLESDGLHSYRRNQTPERNVLWLAETRPCSHIQHPYHESIHIPPERRIN